MKPLTFPHSIIAIKCQQVCNTSWEMLECNVNSLELYYEKVTREELEQRGDKFVVVTLEDAKKII